MVSVFAILRDAPKGAPQDEGSPALILRRPLRGRLEGWQRARALDGEGYQDASAASRRLRSAARSFTLSDFNCPQAAKMSRPRGVRIGEA